jgi:Ca-activated chloride channel family protein
VSSLPLPVVALTPLAQDALAADLPSTASARLHLFGDVYLADPSFLLLLPLCLALFAFGRGRRRLPRAGVSVLPPPGSPRSLSQRLAPLASAAYVVALCAGVVALARPVRADVLRASKSEGVDIVLAVDRSGSMKFEDLDDKQRRTRLDVVKEIVGAFAERRMTDRVGASDNVALLTFARYPQLLCPFTLDAGALRGLLDQVQIVSYEAEDGTAVGRGLAKAVSLLADSAAKSKVVVLLTDGENNVEDVTPLEAAQFAAEKGVRVYTVLAGKYVFMRDVFGNPVATNRELDSSDLQQIAEKTGGRFFRARDAAELEAVYAEIERMERTPRSEQRTVETFDLYPPILLLALLLYAAAWLSFSTWARRLP